MLGDRSEIVFCGAVPGRLTGKSIVTQSILELLIETGFNVRRFTFQTSQNKLRNQCGKLRTLMGAAVHAAFSGGRDAKSSVYLSADGGYGLVLQAVFFVFLASRRRVFIHHHSRWWSKTRPFDFIVTPLLRRAHNIYQCDAVRQLFEQKIGAHTASTLSNAFLVDAGPHGDADLSDGGTGATERTIRLGHMSNLTFEKGLKTAVETFQRGAMDNERMSLILAGPADGLEEAEFLNRVLEQDDRISYLGPVTGAAKKRFFQSIDIFLFPSVYDIETEGIVTLEAMAHGAYVCATNIGCLCENVCGAGGTAFKPAEYLECAPALIAEIKASGVRKSEVIAHFEGIKQRSHNELKSIFGAL